MPTILYSEKIGATTADMYRPGTTYGIAVRLSEWEDDFLPSHYMLELTVMRGDEIVDNPIKFFSGGKSRSTMIRMAIESFDALKAAHRDVVELIERK